MNSKIRFQFDADKAIEVILYIAGKCPDMYKSLKVLYLADKKHLEEYGRFICGDSYYKMDWGPVPSGAYDIVKDVQGTRKSSITEKARLAFVMKSNQYQLLREPDVQKLSESDRECLDYTIEKYGNLTFNELKDISHDAAYNSVEHLNDFIPVEAIARQFKDGNIIIDYLQNEA